MAHRSLSEIRRDMFVAQRNMAEANWETDPAKHSRSLSRLTALQTELAAAKKAESQARGASLYF